MGQAKIIDVLEKVEKPLCRREICEILNDCGTKVSHILSQLIKYNEVGFFEIDRIKARELYGDKAPARRMKLYYINKNKGKK